MPKAKPKYGYGEGGWERLEDAAELRALADEYGSISDILRAAGMTIRGGTQYDKLRAIAAKAGFQFGRGRPGPKPYARGVLGELEAQEVGDARAALEEATKERELLRRQVDVLSRRGRASVCEWRGERLKLGIVSDTHLGSLYANPQLLEAAYDVFAEEGVDDVLHCGDLVDGEKMYKGHEYEIEVHGCDAQRRFVISTYPRREGLRTRFILGSHDLCYWKRSGVNIGEAINKEREDLEYLGPEEHDLEYGPITIRLSHPHGGTAYAISYKMQRLIESFAGGQKPHILLVGHFHKADVLPFYRNVYGVQVATTQSQTPYMRGKPTPAMMGFCILTVHTNKAGVGKIAYEFFPHFEEGG